MENAEEILQCLDEFAKLRPKEIPPELEYYLSFVARTGDPVYQWPLIKCLFREKLLNVITEFYEACPNIEIPPCPNVEIFNYEAMKGFILEKLDTFAAAPFTVQRICELLTSPRKEYNRIDKYMRALEKNILVVSTREPGNRKTENGESVVNGLESEHQEIVNSDINVEEMDEKTVWHKSYTNESILETAESIQDTYVSESKTESVITTRQINYIGYTSEMMVEASTVREPLPSTEIASEAETPEKEIYVTTETYVKPDCSEIITETEPITPPESSEQPETVTSSSSEPVVQVKDEDPAQPEEVVIGPEDMQVEDISPETLPVTENVPETVETIPETVPETVETVPETIETVPESVETVQASVAEAVPESVAETVPESVSETVPETVPNKETPTIDTTSSTTPKDPEEPAQKVTIQELKITESSN